MLSLNQAIDLLERGRQGLDAQLALLTEEELTRAGTLNGGHWSAKDLMAHVALWEELALEVLEARSAGVAPAALAILGGGSAGVEAANLSNQRTSASASLAEVRSRYDQSYASLIAALAGMTRGQWEARGAVEEDAAPLGDLLGRVLAGKGPFDHALEHLPELEAYVKAASEARRQET